MRGWRSVSLWTLVGTLGCVGFSMAFNWLVFRDLPGAAFLRGMTVAAILPVLLAGPLFFYLTLKLRELARLNHMLRELATRDHVTGLLNRRAMIDEVSGVTGRSSAADAQTHLFLVVDADGFKQINDRFGHVRGDEALALMASALKTSIRQYDVIGRLGGEEFGILLPRVTAADAPYVADRLRRAVASIEFRPARERHDLSVSIGGVVFNDDRPFSELFSAADANLYLAKENGRNRCEVTTLSDAVRNAGMRRDKQPGAPYAAPAQAFAAPARAAAAALPLAPPAV
jgi:diguanylate cyclase (GGDEF)-like protein